MKTLTEHIVLYFAKFNIAFSCGSLTAGVHTATRTTKKNMKMTRRNESLHSGRVSGSA